MSKKPLTTLIAAGLLGASASAAVAMPNADDRCALNIKHPTNTAGIKFSEDCKQVYVLPPTTGKVSLAALARNANLQFCPAVLDVHTTSTSIMNSAGTIAEKIEKMIADFEPQSKELEAMRIEVADLEAKRAIAKTKFDAATDRRQEIVDAIATARKDLKDCMDLNSAEECESFSKAVDDAKAELKTFTTNEYRPAENAFNDADLALAPVKKKLGVKTAELAEATAPLFDLFNKLLELNSSVMSLYKEFAALEGATGQLTYSIQWDGLLKQYQDLNPGASVLWRALPIKKATISMTSKINKSNTTLPAVLWVAVPGSNASGPVIPTPTEGAAVTPVSSTSSTVEDKTLPFGGSASAQVGLSLTGACPLFPSGLATVSAVAPDQLAAHVVANASYTFEVKAKRAYTATYHMANFVSRLEKVTKKGGFFTSKNIHEIVEDTNSSDWFSLTFDANSADHQYTSQEKANIAKEVKAQLIQRALTNTAVANGMLKPGVAPPLPGVLPTGASQVAQYMAAGCGWNLYCRVGSYVLLGLNSVFGRQEAISNFKRNNSSWATERVVDYAVFEHARPDESAWIARFHAGDRAILEACYRAQYRTVSRLVGSLVAGRDHDGIVHDVFYRLLTEPDLRASFQGGSFSAWLLAVARNQALNQRRRLARERPIEEAPGGVDEPATELDLDFRRFVERFRRDFLPPKLHPVFEVRFLRHLTQREAATRLGLSRTTLAYQEMQVRRLLKKVLRAGDK